MTANRQERPLVAVVFAVLLVACATDLPPPTLVPPVVQVSTLGQIESGIQSGFLEDSLRVIGDTEGLLHIYRRIHTHGSGLSSVRELDLHSHVALFAFMGARPTTGYHIGFGDVATIADQVATVRVLKTRPRPGANMGQAITTPYAIATLARGDYRSVVFVDQAGARMARYPLP